MKPFAFFKKIVCAVIFALFFIFPPSIIQAGWKLSLDSTYQQSNGRLSSGSAEYSWSSLYIVNGVGFYYEYKRYGFFSDIPLLYQDSDFGPVHYGIGDISAGFHYQALNENLFLPGVQFSVNLTFPTGNAAKNLGLGLWRINPAVSLVKQWSLLVFSLYFGGNIPVFASSGLSILDSGFDAMISPYSGFGVYMYVGRIFFGSNLSYYGQTFYDQSSVWYVSLSLGTNVSISTDISVYAGQEILTDGVNRYFGFRVGYGRY